MKLEDLKVGQYVRFKDKRGNTYIRNIKEVCNEQPHKSWGAIIIDKNANNVPYVSLKNIIKASFDITDILEVGDYVNNERVEEIWKEIVLVGQECRPISFNNIKSIVTKEQFENIKYEI